MQRRVRVLGLAVPLVVLAVTSTGATAGTTSTKSTSTKSTSTTSTTRLTANMSGFAERPERGDRDGTGSAAVRVTGGRICFGLQFRNIGTPAAAHIHEALAGAAGPVVVPLFTAEQPAANMNSRSAWGCVSAGNDVAADIASNAGEYYVNVHTDAYPNGAIRGQLTDTQRFAAPLKSLNANEELGIEKASGHAMFTVKNDQVAAKIDVEGVEPRTLHPQHIHAGSECPTQADDPDHNGLVDVIEGLPKYGGILISLEDTFATTTDDATNLNFPVADADGSYSYSATGSRSHFVKELKQALRLGTRHVVIHGVNPALEPKLQKLGVQSLPGLPAWATLPVACGELHPVR